MDIHTLYILLQILKFHTNTDTKRYWYWYKKYGLFLIRPSNLFFRPHKAYDSRCQDGQRYRKFKENAWILLYHQYFFLGGGVALVLLWWKKLGGRLKFNILKFKENVPTLIHTFFLVKRWFDSDFWILSKMWTMKILVQNRS